MPALGRARKQDAELLETPFFNGLLRRGKLIELAAGTNVGKSFVALRWASHLAGSGLPVLYCDNDTGLYDQAERMFRMVHGRDPFSNEEIIQWNNTAEIPMRWCGSTLDTDALYWLIKAETIYFGKPPALVVIDVLGKLVRGEESVEGVSAVVTTLQEYAREFHCCVVALHHLRDGVAAAGNGPFELSDLRYEKGKYADDVLGLWRGGEGELEMRVLKARNGPVGDTVNLSFDPRRAYVEAA